MRDYIGFFGFVGLILLTLILVRFGLRSYALGQPTNSYQTPLVKSLWSQEGQIWNPVHISSESGTWKITSDQSPKDLNDFLMAQTKKSLILFFDISKSQDLPSLRKILKNQDHWKRIILCSRQDGSLKDLRELEPQWTFCSGEVFLTRILSLASFGLESLVDISADVLFIHLDNMNPNPTLNKLIIEAKRQKKLVLIGPVARPLEGYHPHGWVVKNGD